MPEIEEQGTTMSLEEVFGPFNNPQDITECLGALNPRDLDIFTRIEAYIVYREKNLELLREFHKVIDSTR